MRDLIYEYKKTLRKIRKAQREAKLREQSWRIELNAAFLDKKQFMINMIMKSEEDRKVLSSMEKDIKFILQWLETGRNPDNIRGVDKTEVYTFDPSIIDTHSDGLYKELTGQISKGDKEKIEDALCTLTAREKEVYILHTVEGFSFEKIADLLGVSKSTIQTHQERAEKKIKERKYESLFLV